MIRITTRAVQIVAITVLMLISAAAVAAEGQVYIAPGIQWMHFHNNLDLDNDEGVSLGLGYDFTDTFSGELNYFTMDPKGRFTRNRLKQWRLDALFDLDYRVGRFDTFVVTGLGHNHFESDDETAWNLGAGLKYRLSDNLNFRAAVRNFFILDREKNDLGIDLSLVYRFGEGRAQTTTTSTPASTPAPTPTPAPVADADRDGVPDNRDECPDTPTNYAVDDRGCPIPVEEVARVELDVLFEFDQAEVRPQFYDEIEEVADFMNQYSDVVVELEGHTDSAGPEEYNQGLSERRVNAVRDVLVDRFDIQASRISATGYGETQPVASNETAAGRAANRRVITVIVQTLQNYRPR
ncbi:MAG: OmpA family protein [Pseudohongiellaceae bacterium]